MKSKTQILIIVLMLCLASGLCVASEGPRAPLLTAFYLDSALGSRTLMNQSTVVMEATQEFQAQKSPNEAFLYSLVIPGMGQLYTGAKRGYLYAAADAILLGTYFFLRNNASNTREDYRDVVRKHVTFIGPGSFEDWDPIEDFEHATQYETWNHVYDSDETRARTGKWYWSDLDPNLKNEPDLGIDFDSRYRLEAFDLRQNANDTFQLARTILGVAILNHVVSAVEARISTKRFNTRLQRTLAQTHVDALEIDLQTDMTAGALTGALVLRKRF